MPSSRVLTPTFSEAKFIVNTQWIPSSSENLRILKRVIRTYNEDDPESLENAQTHLKFPDKVTAHLYPRLVKKWSLSPNKAIDLESLSFFGFSNDVYLASIIKTRIPLNTFLIPNNWPSVGYWAIIIGFIVFYAWLILRLHIKIRAEKKSK